MPAYIKPVGLLKTYVSDQSEIEVEAGKTVREALAALQIPSELVALAMLNEQQVPKDYCLKDGDRVMIIAVIGGG